VERIKKGRKVYYSVKEPEEILKMILTYRKGFGEDLARRVEELWANL
jgi:hypothetical protein